ncbi:MAG: hypothetical protein FWG87_09530 [Defluviitaleaceae bacterium]|nr:hypothetical protein [Defluviitaleaceae bacterium]
MDVIRPELQNVHTSGEASLAPTINLANWQLSPQIKLPWRHSHNKRTKPKYVNQTRIQRIFTDLRGLARGKNPRKSA